ncbi:MAG: tetratricopeptide repeat protein [candidate division KSB1 bacterium]|nr:tetratricopeptide repeat protein [candidate division KSB1 bacterium]MDZ7368516.1 tetratricopeptide repeat protein [candidate division KSB1 bacterium]MDZ7406256.1 tetratricopeptide repeat protein [candidate division KSB1 bacterium]
MTQKNFFGAPRFFKTPHAGWWILVLGLSLFFVACGGSKNTNVSTTESEGEIDIDKLLSTPADQEKQDAEDAEVLRLLGITPETVSTETPKTPPPEPVMTEAKPAPDLQKELERLQNELNVKNQQITDLRNSLMERDARLQELQQAQQIQAPRATSGGNLAGANGYVQRYAEARNLYEQRRYAEAAAVFQAILAENDKSSYADNCQYWIGECYYGMGKYAQAIAEFEKVFTFARSNKSDAALLKLGLCYLQMGDRQQARSEFEQLIANYPGSQYVAKARKYLARL